MTTWLSFTTTMLARISSLSPPFVVEWMRVNVPERANGIFAHRKAISIDLSLHWPACSPSFSLRPRNALVKVGFTCGRRSEGVCVCRSPRQRRKKNRNFGGVGGIFSRKLGQSRLRVVASPPLFSFLVSRQSRLKSAMA